MASELVRLRAQLLASASPQAAEEAAAEVDRRLGQLEELAAMKAAAAWLAAPPQLGWDVFARGNQERPAPKPPHDAGTHEGRSSWCGWTIPGPSASSWWSCGGWMRCRPTRGDWRSTLCGGKGSVTRRIRVSGSSLGAHHGS